MIAQETPTSPTRPSAWTSPLAFVLLLTAAVKLSVVSLGATLLWGTPGMGHLVRDLVNWRIFLRFIALGQTPYVEAAIEYPVGATLVYWAMSPLLPLNNMRGLVLAHAGITTAFDLLNTALVFKALSRIQPVRAPWLSLLFSLNLTSLILGPVRFESCVVTFVILGYLCHSRNHPLWATYMWSLGFTMKWFPVFFIATQEWRAFFEEKKRHQWLKSFAILAGVTILVNLPFAILEYSKTGSLRYWLYPYRFHVDRPLYWDTLLGVVELWFGSFGPERFASLWTLGLVAAVLLAKPAMSLERKAILLCIAAIVLNRVYSTQFHLWFYPFLPFVLAKEEGRIQGAVVLFVLLDFFNVLVFPFSFTGALAEMQDFRPLAALQEGGPWTGVFTSAIILREGFLLALAWLLYKEPSPPPRTA